MINYLIIIFIAAVTSLAVQDSARPCLTAGDIYIEECCHSSLTDCNKKKPECTIARHLEPFRQWLFLKEKECKDIDDAVAKRYYTFNDTVSYPIDCTNFEIVGAKDAPIQVVAYISMSCSLCKRLYDELLDSLSGLKIGKYVSVCAKPFTTGRLDRLYAAAFDWGKQSSLLRAIRPIKERLTTEIVLNITDSLGIPRDDIIQKSNSIEISKQIELSHNEGVKNGVRVTPTFFINNVRYASFKDIQWVLDYIRFKINELSLN